VTPFGAQMRALRAERKLTLSRMAADLGVSPAYLSALEHGKRSRPSPGLVRQICGYFGIIWDEADALQLLAQRSQPRVVIDTGGLSVRATELANVLAERIADMPDEMLVAIIRLINQIPGNPRR